MKKTTVKLTDAQISDIVETLHYNIQFRDLAGKPANRKYNKLIRDVLRRYYGPNKYKTVKLPK